MCFYWSYMLLLKSLVLMRSCIISMVTCTHTLTILLLLLLEQLHKPSAALLATSKSVLSPVTGVPGRPGSSIMFTCIRPDTYSLSLEYTCIVHLLSKISPPPFELSYCKGIFISILHPSLSTVLHSNRKALCCERGGTNKSYMLL